MERHRRRLTWKRKQESRSNNEYDTLQGDSLPDHSTETEAKSVDPDSQPTQAPLETPDESIVQQKDSYKDDIPTYYETVPTLQNISSVAVAIELWRQVLRSPDFKDESRFLRSIMEQAKHFLSELPVPGMIRECVGNYLPRVRYVMEKWFRDYKKILHRPLVIDMLFCSWLSECKIDYRASALSMLSNPRLMQEDKFKIMFMYCLEDEIKKSSASVESLSPNFTQSICRSDLLMYYWLCYMRGKIRTKKVESIASRTIIHCDTWSAIEYFWDQLNADEQISKLESILTRRPRFQKNLLSKMSESQKSRIISEIPIKIMGNFWHHPGQERFAFQTWIYIRNFIDHKQFKEMMWIITFHRRTAWDIEDKCRYLADIWNHCPDHLKNLAYESSTRNTIIIDSRSCWNRDFYDCSYNGIEFLTNYLYHFDAEFRKKLIFKRPWAIVSFLDQSVTDHLIKLFLPDSKDVDDFKKIVLGSSDIRQLIRKTMKQNEDFDAVDKFMDYFCPDSRTRAEFCYDILRVFNRWSDLFSERGTTKMNNLFRFLRDNVENSLPDRFEQLRRNFEPTYVYLQSRQQFSGST